jgi:hypothetical protein
MALLQAAGLHASYGLTRVLHGIDFSKPAASMLPELYMDWKIAEYAEAGHL